MHTRLLPSWVSKYVYIVVSKTRFLNITREICSPYREASAERKRTGHSTNLNPQGVYLGSKNVYIVVQNYFIFVCYQGDGLNCFFFVCYRGDLFDVARGVGREEKDGCRKRRERMLRGAPAHVHKVRHLKKRGIEC